MTTTFHSATVEDKATGKRYVFATVDVHDAEGYVVVKDKRSQQVLTTVEGDLGARPAVTRDWWTIGAGGSRVRENCGPCTRNRTTKVEPL